MKPRQTFTATRTPPLPGSATVAVGPSTSRRRPWARRSKGCGRTDGWDICRACSRCGAVWPRRSLAGAWRYPPRERPGAWQQSSASRNGSRPADTVDSIIAGIRGDQDAAGHAAARAERVAVPTGANITVAFAQFGRIFAALGAGRHAEA